MQTTSLPGRSRYYTQSLREPDPPCLTGHPSCCNYLLCETLNRSEGLFYPLILYGMTHLCKPPNRSDGFFHPLTLDGLFTWCASYRIGQTDSSTLWHSTACSLCKTPNRSIDTWRLFCSQQGWGGDHRHGLHTTMVSATFDLYTSSVWSANIIATLVSRQSDGKVPWLWEWWDWHAWYDVDTIRLIEGLIALAKKVGGWSWQVTYRREEN